MGFQELCFGASFCLRVVSAQSSGQDCNGWPHEEFRYGTFHRPSVGNSRTTVPPFGASKESQGMRTLRAEVDDSGPCYQPRVLRPHQQDQDFSHLQDSGLCLKS